jgi:hypothetical protein
MELVCLKIEILIYMFHDEIVESLFYLDATLLHDCLSRYVTACRLTLYFFDSNVLSLCV